jgi:hypothetical protein
MQHSYIDQVYKHYIWGETHSESKGVCGINGVISKFVNVNVTAIVDVISDQNLIEKRKKRCIRCIYVFHYIKTILAYIVVPIVAIIIALMYAKDECNDYDYSSNHNKVKDYSVFLLVYGFIDIGLTMSIILVTGFICLLNYCLNEKNDGQIIYATYILWQVCVFVMNAASFIANCIIMHNAIKSRDCQPNVYYFAVSFMSFQIITLFLTPLDCIIIRITHY